MLCMDSSSLHCSTPMPAATASSPSRSSRRRPAGPCCRCCAPASGHRARKSSKSCVTSSVASVATGPRSRSWCAARQSLRDARSDGLAGREALQLHLRTVYQPALDRDRAALERGCRHTPSIVKNAKDAALLPDQLCRSQLEQAPQGRRPRRGERARQRHTLHRHQPARPGKSPLRKGLLRTRAHGESHQGHEALHALRPHLLPPLGGQSVPPVPSHGGLLALARTQGRRAKTLNLAHSNLRDHPLLVPQDRCAHPRAQDPHQDGAALKLSARSSLDRARHLNRRLRSMSNAASAAPTLSLNLQRVANVPEHPPPSIRLMPCARVANRHIPRIIGARCHFYKRYEK